jgi:hypothetical protein
MQLLKVASKVLNRNSARIKLSIETATWETVPVIIECRMSEFITSAIEQAKTLDRQY